MAAAMLQGKNVVNFLYRCRLALRYAVFTQRMGGDVGSADASPASTVTLVDLRIALVAAIALVLSLSVLGTESFVG